MRYSNILALAVCASVLASTEVAAYGGGGGGGSTGCAEPKFFEVQPSGTVAAIKEVSFVASDNTEIATLTVEVGQTKLQPVTVKRGSGDYDAKVTLAQPITAAGKVRIAINAKSKDGCWGLLPSFVEVKP